MVYFCRSGGFSVCIFKRKSAFNIYLVAMEIRITNIFLPTLSYVVFIGAPCKEDEVILKYSLQVYY